MTAIQVQFNLPAEIVQGLTSGAYERIGGVIRQTDSKHVVAWLRDCAAIGSSADPSLILGAVALKGAARVVPLVNLAISSATLIRLSQQIDSMYALVEATQRSLKAEFQADREAHLKAALLAAQDALQASNKDVRHQRAQQASKDLYQAMITLQSDVDAALRDNHFKLAALQFASHAHVLIAIARCYLEIDEYDLARSRLVDQRVTVRRMAELLVSAALGEHPALMLHRDIPDENAYRFLDIYEWLRGKGIRELLVNELRRDFWNNSLTHFDLGRAVRRQHHSLLLERVEAVDEVLSVAESVKENLNRLEGFIIELRSMRLTGHDLKAWHDLHRNPEQEAVLLASQPLAVDDF